MYIYKCKVACNRINASSCKYIVLHDLTEKKSIKMSKQKSISQVRHTCDVINCRHSRKYFIKKEV